MRFLPPFLGVYSRILPFIIFRVISIMVAVLGILLPETRNKKLTDLISEVKPIRGYVPTCNICKKGKSFSLSSHVCFCLKGLAVLGNELHGTLKKN